MDDSEAFTVKVYRAPAADRQKQIPIGGHMGTGGAPQENSTPALIEHDLLVVGVPVFNEARYLRECLQSLQAQSWTDFAVLIADNGSTDKSHAIAREFCEADSRFHLHVHQANRGSLANYKFLRDATASPLFMWLGAHDLLHPEYLSETIAAHRRTPEISLAYSLMKMIDSDGSTEYFVENERAARMPRGAMARYLHAYRFACGWEGSHLLRRSAFDDFEFRKTVAWDLIFLAHLGFRGPFECISSHLYSIRNVHPREQESDQQTMERLTGEKGYTSDAEQTLRYALDDFTGLARGRAGWTIYKALLRAIVLHRTRPNEAGWISALVRLTAPVRSLFGGRYVEPTRFHDSKHE